MYLRRAQLPRHKVSGAPPWGSPIFLKPRKDDAMPRPKDTLDRLNINTPCTADWDDMVGNDQVRFCKHCDLSVHNLSAMTRQEALRLVISSKGKLCARYIRRPDGVIRTTDLILPKLHSIKRRASRLAAGAFTAALSVSTSVVAAAPARSALTSSSPSASSLLAKRVNSNSPGTTGASVTGVVKDPNGAVISGATVTLVDQTSGLEQTTTTNDEGVFVYQNLQDGGFTLKIECEGFSVKEISDLTLGPNEDKTVDASLDVAGEMITVGGGAFIAPSDPLVAAAVNGDVDEVKSLLATGTDVDTIDEDYDSTALSQAVANGNLEVVDVLINAGADVNLKNHSGHTALMAITGSTTEEIVRALIDAGVKTDLRDDDGKDALHYAAGYATPNAVGALLLGGAYVDGRDEDDRTALMIAASVGNTENVAVLLKAGAIVNLRDEDGTTALGLAIESDYTETADALRDFGATE